MAWTRPSFDPEVGINWGRRLLWSTSANLTPCAARSVVGIGRDSGWSKTEMGIWAFLNASMFSGRRDMRDEGVRERGTTRRPSKDEASWA